MITKVNKNGCIMNGVESLEKNYIEKRTSYFKKNFIGKNINEVLYFVSKEFAENLIKSYLKINIIKDCIDTIKDDKRFDSETKQAVYDTFECINSYRNELEHILNSVYNGFCE